MKIKEEIENLKDIRRNLWVTSVAIIGSLAFIFLNANSFIFNWIVLIKIIIAILGILTAYAFLCEVACCNKQINKLITKLKED